MSEKLARELFSEAQQFIGQLSDTGWTPAGLSRAADGLADHKSPQDLFTVLERPLVVGLFGGTGVGKSSLLNRLAGDDIARTGVVRPTSMEITAYLHHAVQLDALPQHFDTSSFSATRHNNDALADVMWVDMPDFDSDETDNKDQVLQWLPHIDLLIYVVTPERYKDAEGWRMMLDNGYRHAWIFVINQWDRADAVQYEDFSRQLVSAGFESPQVFRTVCVGEHNEDQFDDMVQVISSLSRRNVVALLQERGWMQRLQRSRAQLQQHNDTLSAAGTTDLVKAFDSRWHEFEQSAAAHLDTPFKAHSELFAEDKTRSVSGVLKSLTGRESNTEVASSISNRKRAGTLWDEWLSVRFKDSLQQFQLAGSEHGVPATVFTESDQWQIEDIDEIMDRHLNQSVEQAIRLPGTPAQRLVSKLASVLKLVLPLFALLWVAWRVVNGFVSGAEDRSAYVGMDFLVNGLLLAGLGWVIPWLVEKIFVPSLPDSIYRAMHEGVEAGFNEIEQEVRPQLKNIDDHRKAQLSTCDGLQKRIDQLLSVANDAPNPILNRVLMNHKEDSV